MKHSKKEIEEIAKRTLEEIDFDYIKTVDLSVDELDLELSYHGMTKPTWVVDFMFEVGVSSKTRPGFIYVDDESGKPLIVRHRDAKIELTVLENGKIEKKIKRRGEP